MRINLKQVLQFVILLAPIFNPIFGQSQGIELEVWKQDLYHKMQLITKSFKQKYSYFSLFEDQLSMKVENIDALNLQEVRALCDTAITLNPIKKWKKMYISYEACDNCEEFSYRILVIFVSKNKVWEFQGGYPYVPNYQLAHMDKIIHIIKRSLKSGYTPRENIGDDFLTVSEFDRHFKLLRSEVFLEFLGYELNIEFSSKKFREQNPGVFDNTN